MSEFYDQSIIQRYSQSPAGNTEKYITLEPHKILDGLISSHDCLKDYHIYEFGQGFRAAEFMLQHIVTNKLNESFQKKSNLWHKTVAVLLECKILATENGESFAELKPTTAEDINPEFAATEGPDRLADIYTYLERFSGGEDVTPPLYVTGAVLNNVGTNIDPKLIFMMDGARRIVAAALAHRSTINVYLLMDEVQYAQLIKETHLQRLANQIRQIQWFDSYQTIPLVGLQGQRSLKRFDLIDMSVLQGHTVMDFGCNLGQSCIKAVQTGADNVIGIEGMKDTYGVACEIGNTVGFPNLHYLNVNFNDLHFNKKIDEYYPHKVDFSFFLSVYRTKELNQREQLFHYIINKTNKGIFFEGHAHPKIDTREYYDWLFDCFKLKYKFLGYSEGYLRPLFYCPIESHSSYPQISRPMTETSARVPKGVPDEKIYSVSAIISTYKSEKFIEGKIQDLLNQTIGNQLEIIIIDSNSPENAKTIVTKYAQKHKNIKYIRTEKRETIYKTWNRGIKEAHGKFITNANTEDRLKPDAFEILVDELNRNSDIALVYGDFFITNCENQDFFDHIRCGYSIKSDYSPEIMLSGCHMGPLPMWRKSVHDEIGYFDENLQSAGDYEFWCRLATKYSMKHINKFIGLYYHNPKGIVNNKSNNETSLIKEKYKDKFPLPSRKTPTGYYYKDRVSRNSYVNISMVTYNRLDFTKQAIASILKNTRYPHVITVVDNNSQDGTQEYLTEIKREGIIKNLLLLDENVGVSKASNLAWKMEPDAEYYLKLDNDIVIFKTDWLSDMIKAIDAIPQIGAIAYNFEVQSYPLTEFNGFRCRVKAQGNLGGACILIPKRTREQLGYWCEDYGLYGEEDGDYDFRIKCKGLLNVYMEDENIGFHLPGGKAAVIDPHTYTATDGQEEIQQADYRKWKDEMRRNNVTKGKFYRNLNEYSKGIRSLYAESKFADQYLKQKSRSTELNDQIERKEARVGKLKVSIIIPVFNQIEFTKKCLNAIFQNTPPDLFEIIIIDNASTDETSIFLSNLRERIKFITNNQNMGFAKACNQGVNKASGKYLLFLNNDTEVQPEWLNSLVEVLDKDKSVAAVGSKLLFPDKTIQHAGVEIVNNQKLPDPLVARHIYYQQAENYPKANEISTYQALTAACLLVRRSAFEAVEGFDELYWNGYEDTDLGFKFQKQGWLLIYQPKSVVIHYESQSGPERFSRVQHNIERLHQKWLGKINPDLMIKPDGTEIETGAGCIRPYQMETSANQQLIDSTELIKQFTSIIILTCNQIEYTKKCIDSIFKHTQEPFELILVDNGSTDGTLEYLESEIAVRNGEVRVKIIKNKKNKGFAAGNNQGIATAKGDYILLMNNDVVVTPDWLRRMIACAEKHPKIGIVGPRSNCVSGPQLVEKVNYDINTLKGLTEFSKQFAEQHAQQDHQILRVVGFCMLIKRAVIEAIGGMDDRYGLGNFEDDDFSLRATIAGFQSWIALDSFIHHFGNRTFVGEKIDYRSSLFKNWELFKEKWGLPFELPYGSPYNLSQMKHTTFDHSIHYYPLEEEGYSNMNFDYHPSKAEDLYASIQTQLKTMSTNEAIAEIEKLLANLPEFAIGYNDLGVLHYQAGNKEDSLKNYEMAVRLDPENMVFQKNLADYYYVEMGRVEDALQIYVKILEANPEDVETLLITGHICVALEKFQDAEVFYSRVLEIDPGHQDARQFLDKLNSMEAGNPGAKAPEALYDEIQPLLNNGDPHRAIAALVGLLEKFPDFAVAYNDLGVLYYHIGEKEKAQHFYERAVENFYCLELGRIEEALNIYVDILTTHPRDIETLLATGQICVALERPGDAKDFYHRVLELEPDNEDASNYLQTLDKHPTTNALLPSESVSTVSVLTDKFKSNDLEPDRSAAENRAATVSIIINLDGIQNCVKECIKSVMAYTPEPHEILLINRGATKGILKWAQQLIQDNEHYRILNCARQAGRAESINEAVEKACGDMIVLMHNDVVVPEGWFKAFTTCINLVSNIGIVGPMSNRTEGIQQMIPFDESDRAEFESAAKTFYEQNEYRRVATRKLSDFCLAFPRELPDKIGYFDEQFSSEEVVIEDFCKRAVSGGYQNLIAADTYVHHYDRHKAKKSASARNQAKAKDRKKYNEKWNGAQNPKTKAALTVQLLARAEELSQKSQIDPAVEVLLGGIGVQPEDPRVYLGLSEILLAAKRFQDAKDALTEMPPADENQEIRKAQLLAYAEEGLENYEAAQAQIEPVLLMNPDHAPALNLKGILAYRNDDSPSAEKYFKRAIDSDPGYGEPYTNLGMLSLETDRPQDALKFFEKAFRLTPADFDIATNYHSYIGATADFISAELLAREAAALYPNNQKIKYMLIDFLVQQGKYEMAMPEIEEAIIKFGSDNGIISAALKVREKLGPITIQKFSKKAFVSVCMIIKDEEKYLARCLASVKPIVDEMIVVDTGSTDRSKDIAIDYEWRNDFAEARNYSISQASGEWILIIDGDEVISALDHEHFGKIVQKTPRAPIAYSITTRNYNKLANIVGWMSNDGKYPDEETAIGWLPSEKVRLFYGKDQIWFEGAVHELVDPVLKRNGIEIQKCRIPVHHYGRLDKEKLNRKGEIYFDIGRKKLSSMGDDLNALRELAIQATILEKNQEAFELWQRLLALNPNPHIAAIAYVNMGTIYNRLGKFEDALDAGKKAVKFDPDLKEARYNHAMAELHCGNAPQTIGVLEDLLKGFPDYPPARFILSAAYCCADQKEKGLEGIKILRDTPMGK